MIAGLIIAAALAQPQPSPAAPQPVRPEAQCVRDRVEQSAALDVSARLLAAEIADRCSELISAETQTCSQTVSSDVTNRGAVLAYCERMLADIRGRRTAALERLAYQLLLVYRQQPSRQ